MISRAFGKNFAADADILAPTLAKLGGVACMFYYWLQSRYFSCHNEIGVSQIQLSEIFSVGRQTIQRAQRKLVKENLISAKPYRGGGGGMVYSIVNAPGVLSGCYSEEALRDSSMQPKTNLNAYENMHNIEKDINKNKKEEESSIPEHAIEDVIDHLNKKVGTNFKASDKTTRRLIANRINEGNTYEDFEKVIDVKAEDWAGTKYATNLIPLILFSSKHFDTYRNQADLNSSKKGNDYDFSEYANIF